MENLLHEGNPRLFTQQPDLNRVWWTEGLLAGLPVSHRCRAAERNFTCRVPANCLLPLKSRTPTPYFSFVRNDTCTPCTTPPLVLSQACEFPVCTYETFNVLLWIPLLI